MRADYIVIGLVLMLFGVLLFLTLIFAFFGFLLGFAGFILLIIGLVSMPPQTRPIIYNQPYSPSPSSFPEGVKYCIMCGALNPKSAQFCQRCGNRFPQ
jgi:hypothetical protein